MKNLFKVGNGSKNTYKDTKFFMKGLFGLLDQFLCLDPDPHSQYLSRSGSKTEWMRIQAETV